MYGIGRLYRLIIKKSGRWDRFPEPPPPPAEIAVRCWALESNLANLNKADPGSSIILRKKKKSSLFSKIGARRNFMNFWSWKKFLGSRTIREVRNEWPPPSDQILTKTRGGSFIHFGEGSQKLSKFWYSFALRNPHFEVQNLKKIRLRRLFPPWKSLLVLCPQGEGRQRPRNGFQDPGKPMVRGWSRPRESPCRLLQRVLGAQVGCVPAATATSTP